jgi:hypothetical protein
MACLHKCLYVTQMDQRAGKNTQACKHAHTPPMTYSRTRGESSDMVRQFPCAPVCERDAMHANRRTAGAREALEDERAPHVLLFELRPERRAAYDSLPQAAVR